MKKALWVLTIAVIAIATLFAWAVYKELAYDECGLSEKQARKSALKQVLRMRLPPEHLASEPYYKRGTCSYSFVYEGAGRQIDFVIFSDWLHGVKTNWWDQDRDER
ncbi:hypothetical protein [uncultured Salinisphaera sp.]|uniref:hypothetical protein n=1 Tax=uncultured Salinisphaera sp. TaxID=359372 RepID=UPI0032B2DDC9|tara:strand:- start:192 stop:509 length:318 start_codon:yes stop_codon:yes gene_type:complete